MARTETGQGEECQETARRCDLPLPPASVRTWSVLGLIVILGATAGWTAYRLVAGALAVPARTSETHREGGSQASPQARPRRQRETHPVAHQRRFTPAEALLIIDGGHASAGGGTLVPYERLIRALSAKTKATPQQIADTTAGARKLLKEEHGISTSCLQIMQGVHDDMVGDGSLGWSYAEYAAVWITLLVEGR